MVRRRQRERSVWEVVLPDASKLWPAALRRIDQLIDDEALVEVIAAALERRYPKSRRRGRPGTPAEVVLRMLILNTSMPGATRSWSTRSGRIWCIARSPGLAATPGQMTRRF